MNCKDCYVEGCTHRPFPNETECVFRQWTAKQFDWQSFRAEAAKDILCAMINRENQFLINGKTVLNPKDFVEMSIQVADKLIAKLKEKEEK